jgi:hypothetical protein
MIRRSSLGLLVMVGMLMTSGCFTTWTLTQLSGTARVWDENVREQVVPLPGIEERLTVTMPLVTEYEYQPAPYQAAGATPVAAPPPKAKPWALGCDATQRGRDVVYHAAFRYGSSWKKGTAIAALVEGLSASLLLLVADRKPDNVLAGGFFAVDALGSAILFFAPRKEIYRKDERLVTTPVRTDCPDGLMLDIAGTAFPVDAAGQIGELGDAALDEWMHAPNGPVSLSIAGQNLDLRLGEAERCAWLRDHKSEQQQTCGVTAGVLPRTASTSFMVPPGTLTVVAAGP